MPKFSYKAINAKGRPVRGIIAAANEADLFNRRQVVGMALVDAKEITEKSKQLQALTMSRVKTRDSSSFSSTSNSCKKRVFRCSTRCRMYATRLNPRGLRDVMSDVYNEVSEGACCPRR